MRSFRIIYVALICFAGLAFSSCEDKENKKGKVEFSFNEIDSDLTKSATVAEPSFLEFTIKSEDGKFIESYKVKIQNFNGSYISEPIDLESGKYKLTKFLVLNDSSKAIYACPVAGSPKAFLVKDPLDIDFQIKNDEITKVVPEVISTENAVAKDFGYLEASFEIVPVFDFQLAVFVFNETTKEFELVNAELVVSGDNQELYVLNLENATNIVTVNENYELYKLQVKKQGYETVDIELPKDELKAAFNAPLKVTLKKLEIDINLGLIAYYPFNGNANDATGNNHGTVYGASLCKDKFGNDSQAYSFDPNFADRILCGNDPVGDNASVTVSVNVFPKTPLHSNPHTKYDNEYIVSTGGQTISAGYYVLWNNGQFEVGRHTFTSVCDTVFGNYQPYKWYNIAFTFDASTGVEKIYVNGNLVVVAKSVYKEIQNHNYINLSIGIANMAYMFGNQWSFNGLIDELRIYNRVLDGNEIQALSSRK